MTIITVSEQTAHWADQVLPLLSHEAQRRGWRLVRGWHHMGKELPTAFKLDGALTNCGPTNAQVQALVKKRIPVVRLGESRPTSDEQLPTLLHDRGAGALLAANHFHELGFQHVAFGGTDPWERHAPLVAAFQERAAELRMDYHELHITFRQGQVTTRALRKHFLEWIAAAPAPIGLLTGSDFRAAQFCYWATEAGIDVPNRLALVGSGNHTSICDCTVSTLSSIEPDEAGRAQRGCELLAHLMAGGSAPNEPIVVPPKGVVTRESTNVLAVSDPRVRKALRYMWDHLDLDLSVDDIAREVGVSRRTLEYAFRQQLQRGVNAELRRKRLQVLRELLITTDMPIASLAPQVGFRTMVHLQRSFREAYGMSPRQFRAQEMKSKR